MKTLHTCIVIISLFLLLAEASKKGGKKGGGWNSGNNNRNPSYPGGNQNPSYPNYPGNAGGNRNPNYPGNTWNTGNSWGHNYNPSGGSSFNNKQFKPPKAKTNMKMVAGAAVAGAAGGFLLGNAIGNMRYHFNNDDEYRYYNRYSNQLPDRVYRPMYDDQRGVSRDRFVTDCYNMTVTEYIINVDTKQNSSEVDPIGNSVKKQMIREMCITEYARGYGLKLFSNPWLVIFIGIFVHFVIQ
ncbi:major prion protein homolog isoform 1-T2 [Discoglossus pictus]